MLLAAKKSAYKQQAHSTSSGQMHPAAVNNQQISCLAEIF